MEAAALDGSAAHAAAGDETEAEIGAVNGVSAEAHDAAPEATATEEAVVGHEAELAHVMAHTPAETEASADA
jgi:hypothetical protein